MERTKLNEDDNKILCSLQRDHSNHLNLITQESIQIESNSPQFKFELLNLIRSTRSHPMMTIHAHLPSDHMAVDLVGQLVETDSCNMRLLELSDIQYARVLYS